MNNKQEHIVFVRHDGQFPKLGQPYGIIVARPLEAGNGYMVECTRLYEMGLKGVRASAPQSSNISSTVLDCPINAEMAIRSGICRWENQLRSELLSLLLRTRDHSLLAPVNMNRFADWKAQMLHMYISGRFKRVFKWVARRTDSIDMRVFLGHLSRSLN
jgi:hypothetical protein